MSKYSMAMDALSDAKYRVQFDIINNPIINEVK